MLFRSNVVAVMAILIYANFFAHHYIGDYRWYLAACALGLYARSTVVFRPMDRDRTMPLLLSFVPELLRHTVDPLQRSLFGRLIVEPEVVRMLLFGLALMLMMLFRPAGLWPSKVRKRELAEE